ncbi:vacuolar assembling protein VPS41 [Gloeopeniophorella convolvens]|nr:vacuolar assembling protein VPS41 [Gloeopeniophorella convolvens]
MSTEEHETAQPAAIAEDTTSTSEGHEPNGTAAAAATPPRISAEAEISDEKEGDTSDQAESGAPEAEDEEEDGSEEDVDGDEEDEGEGDEDEEDDEDEDEPALKYERLGGALQDLFKKDSASALAVSNKLLALGSHSGFVHILDLTGQRIRSFKPHTASVIDICFDSTADFIGTASMDGQVFVHSLSSSESYVFDMKRPLRSLALEPYFAKRGSRAIVCGGMAGTLVMHEKGWLGHKASALHSGEGPIWNIRWRGTLIAWANELGVKVYDTASQTRLTYIERHPDSPRSDLFKCTLHWQDDSTLLIAWADIIKVARIRARPRTSTSAASAGQPPFLVEITAVFQLDCMIAGVVPHFSLITDRNPSVPTHPRSASTSSTTSVPSPTSLLVLAYMPADTLFLHEATEDRAMQARKTAERPELRIISRAGEELAADALSVTGYQSWGCNDYMLAEIDPDDTGKNKSYLVLSPKDVIVVRPRDRKDHIEWLVERKRYEDALEQIEIMGSEGAETVDAVEIGQRYIEHLVAEGDFLKAAQLFPKVCGQETKRWENWIFVFAQKQQLQAIIPYVPTEKPRLDHLVYEMILAYFLANDRQALQRTIHEWPKDIYDISAVIVAIQSDLDRQAPSSSRSASPTPQATPDTAILMECLAELYTANRQPAKALPFFIRLRRPNVFDLIREHNLFTAVQDQALLLVEFDHELMSKQKGADPNERGIAITLLVDHIHSIPIPRVVQQLRNRSRFLFLYLDALFERDAHLIADFADTLVELYAEYAPAKLIDFLRASNYYNLEAAYKICTERDLVPEMVFLLGRMGDNKRALHLIIERLGDVNRAIDFAKDQNDDDLWEDLLKYSETRPSFIRGLLENVGAEIDPIRLIRRIKNGLEIPGLKPALIKILQDFNLQISLLEGCQTVLHGDSSDLAKQLHLDQTSGFLVTSKTACPICNLPLQESPSSVVLLFLCRHAVHARHVDGGDDLPPPPDPVVASVTFGGRSNRGISNRIAYTAIVRAKVRRGCPVCHEEGQWT